MGHDSMPKKTPQHSRIPLFKDLKNLVRNLVRNREPGLANPTNANPGSFTANYLPIKKALRQQKSQRQAVGSSTHQ